MSDVNWNLRLHTSKQSMTDQEFDESSQQKVVNIHLKVLAAGVTGVRSPRI